MHKNIKIKNNPSKVSVPGQFKLHYSPGIPIRLNVKKIKDKEAYILIRKKKFFKSNYYFLSKKGNLKEAAKNLYSTLRKIKKSILLLLLVKFQIKVWVKLLMID